ncbi:hypothetical protein GGS20DRAFT_548898 [Poronia punctata]|nr:hypothetical protein GGS20DRAFT_548898 [Poronia punctata]
MSNIPENRHRESRRRRRPALACQSCRRSKIRCDRKQPCSACARSRHKICVFGSFSDATLPGSGTGIRSSRTLTLTSPEQSEHTDTETTPVSSNTTGARTRDNISRSDKSDSDAPLNLDGLINRIFDLERRLEETSTTTRTTTTAATTQEPLALEKNPRQGQGANDAEGTIDNFLAVDVNLISRGVVSKTRYFGQSHWMNYVIHFRPLFDLFEQQSKDAKSEAVAIINRCKSMARKIKEDRNPGIITKFGTHIPTSRDVADKLVDGYLRTTEAIFRVLHIPTFKRQYEEFWPAASLDKTDMSFIILLQLVMAIGATVYDGTFTMRKSAVQWVTEGQYWILGPSSKGRLTIPGLQIMVLLSIARETASVGQDLVWIQVGSLLRSALYMGLHRDPGRLPKMSRLEAEMRRRLWNTILEIELKSSMDAGGYPNAAIDMADTKPPADVDDVDLLREEDTDEVEVEIEKGEKFTDMTIPLLFRESFRDRLAIYQMLNATPFRGTYDDTIRLHRNFASAFKNLITKLRTFNNNNNTTSSSSSSSSSSSTRHPTSFQCRLVEIMARRCLMSLHLPYLGPSTKDPALFAFSRAQIIEMSTKIYILIFPSATLYTTGPIISPQSELLSLSSEDDDLARLAICGAGFWRLLGCQPSMMATLELHMAAREEEGLGLGLPFFRSDLLSILRHSLSYYLSRIEAGETNVKGYLFNTALAGHVQAAMEGRSGQQVLEPVLSAAIKTERICYDILKRQAAAAAVLDDDGDGEGEGEGEGEGGNGEEGGPFDWDFMAVDGGWDDPVAMRSFFEASGVDSLFGVNGGFDFVM